MASFFMFADSVEVPDMKKNVFRQIALQIHTLSSLYDRDKITEGNAQASLQEITDLQAEKNGYMASFLSIDQEKNTTLAEKETFSQRNCCLFANRVSLSHPTSLHNHPET